MASPANPTATTASCPQCEGYGVERAVGRQGTAAVILTTPCGLCGGTGRLPTVAVAAPVIPDPTPPPQVLALWPFLVPVALFVLFFLYLWL
jgi:hypothetical protein